MLLNAQPDGTKILTGTAQVYADRLTSAGVRQGQKFLGQITEMKIRESEETWEEFSAVTPDRALIASGVLRRTVEISAVLKEVRPFNLALWSQGTELTLSQTSGSFASGAGDPVGGAGVTCKGGFWYPVSKRNITAAGIVMKHTTAAGSTVPAADYEVDLRTGHVFVKAGGAGDNKLLFLEYTYGADTRNAVSGADSNITAYVRVLGDVNSGPIVEAEFWKVQLSPDGEFNFIGDQPTAFPIKGKVLNDAVNHPTNPYFLLSA